MFVCVYIEIIPSNPTKYLHIKTLSRAPESPHYFFMHKHRYTQHINKKATYLVKTSWEASGK